MSKSEQHWDNQQSYCKTMFNYSILKIAAAMILNPTEPRLQPCCECCANQESSGCRQHQATNKHESNRGPTAQSAHPEGTGPCAGAENGKGCTAHWLVNKPRYLLKRHLSSGRICSLWPVTVTCVSFTSVPKRNHQSSVQMWVEQPGKSNTLKALFIMSARKSITAVFLFSVVNNHFLS